MSIDPRITDVLNDCIERLRQGATIEDCLRAWPAEAPRLRPLLKTAQQVWLAGEMLSARPTFRLELRSRLVATAKQRRTRRRSLARLLRSFGPLAATVVALAVVGSTAVSASSESLPGDTLYPVKRAAETVTMTMTADPSARATLSISMVERRLTEIEQLSAANRPISPTTINALASQTEQVFTLVEHDNLEAALNSRLAALAARQQAILTILAEQAPDTALPAIERAEAATRRGLEQGAPTPLVVTPKQVVPVSAATPTAAAEPTVPPAVKVNEATTPMPGQGHGMKSIKDNGKADRGTDDRLDATPEPQHAVNAKNGRQKSDDQSVATVPTSTPDDAKDHGRNRPDESASTPAPGPQSGQRSTIPTPTSTRGGSRGHNGDRSPAAVGWHAATSTPVATRRPAAATPTPQQTDREDTASAPGDKQGGKGENHGKTPSTPMPQTAPEHQTATRNSNGRERNGNDGDQRESEQRQPQHSNRVRTP